MSHTNRLTRPVVESLETRDLMAAAPLPVLMVLADHHDFCCEPHGETLRAADAPTKEYSAIAFVGGWGSSMDQSAFEANDLALLATLAQWQGRGDVVTYTYRLG